MKIINDIEIIKQVLNGNTNAYRTIIDRHKSSCFNLAYRILGNREDAEECIADGFMNAFKALGTYNDNLKFRSWILKIVYNRAISIKRKKKIPTLQIEENEFLVLEYELPSAYSNLFKEDKIKLIDNALSYLDEESKAIVNLFYYEESTLEEISQIMNLNTNTIKSKLFRARQKMNWAIKRFYQNEEKLMVQI